MRFRWCGDGDCPDWVLAEMATLSRLSSVKLKTLAMLVAQGLVSPPLDMEKAEKLFTDSKFDDCSVVKRCVSCISWIILETTRYGCDAAALGGELQQLGLPREHALAIKRVYVDHVEALRAKLYQQSLRVDPLSKATFRSVPSLDAVEVELSTDEESCKKGRVLVSRSLLESLLQDAKSALSNMEELQAADHAL